MDDFARDIRARSKWALHNNEGHPNGVWSTGEQLAVALVLNDLEHLEAMGYTRDEAKRRVAGGMMDPPANFEAWLAEIRDDLNAQRPPLPLTPTPYEPTTAAPATADYSTEQIAEMLAAGARLAGRLTNQAAVHLLTSTDVIAAPAVRNRLEIAEETTRDGHLVMAAFLKRDDWAAILNDTEVYLSGSEERLLRLAASLAAGEPVDLGTNLTGFGSATAKRVQEAVAIALGLEDRSGR